MHSVSLRRLIAPVLLVVTLLASASPVYAKDSIVNLLKNDKSTLVSNDDDFLKPDEAFKFSAEMKRPDAITLTWVIAEKYYLYRDRIKISTEDTALVQLGKPQFPQGQTKQDEYFGEQVVFHELLEVIVPVARAADAKGEFKLKVTYQGCAEAGLCYNPITKYTVLTLPATDKASTLTGKAASDSSSPGAASGNSSGGVTSEQDFLAGLLTGNNLAYALLMFFVAGLGLSVTPCVLPMIPILSGIIVGQGDKITRGKSFSLAFTYVQGMALTYAGVGAVFALLFKQTPQAFFQQGWIIILMGTLFVALAFAMFGAYTLQMPSAIQTRFTNISNDQKAGTFIGTFIMGTLSALVVTACVAPVIIGALTVIIQSHQVARGALALYASGIGMGVPLLIVGASAGDLLPRAGAWMDTVKQLFGVLFLAVALYLVRPLLPDSVSMLLWSALTIVSGFWIFSLKGRDGPAPSPVRGFGLIAIVYGILLLIGVGAGRTDPLQPLAGIGAISSASNGGGAAAATSKLPFERIKSESDLDSFIAAAKAAGKPVMIDFTAEWCISCKEMEKYTFSNSQVQAALANAVLLRADVTANNDDDQALLKRFGIYGPPSIMFFGADGMERKNFRVVGYMPADKFHTHVTDAFSS